MTRPALRVLVALVNVIVAIGVPLLIGLLNKNPFSPSESYLLGVLLFIAVTSLEIYLLAERAFAKEVRVQQVWAARTDLDSRLQEVRRLFHSVQEKKVATDDLFVRFFDHRLKMLERDLRDAESKHEVRIDGTMLEVTTWLLESSFAGRDEDIFRAVHFTSDNDFFLGLHSRRYFSQVKDLVGSGRIKGVKRLIVDDGDGPAFADPCSQRIVDFHHHAERYECRRLSRSAFAEVLRDYQLESLVRDFGIYGQAYLYKGVRNTAEEIIGHYSREPDEIARFIDCFETCWDSATATTCSGSSPVVSLDALFAPSPPTNQPPAAAPAAG